VVEKILIFLIENFDYVVNIIEESIDITHISLSLSYLDFIYFCILKVFFKKINNFLFFFFTSN